MKNLLFWGIAAGVGALLGAVLPLPVVIWTLGALVAAAFLGGFGAAFAGWIRPEWLYLLMLVLPVAAAILASAAIVNAIVRRRDKANVDTESRAGARNAD
jgi:ABC-type transport system involved in multi-copper enzyme maturation permease subunit